MMNDLRARLERLVQVADRVGNRRTVVGFVLPDGTYSVNGRRITAEELAHLEAIHGPDQVIMVRFMRPKEMEDEHSEDEPAASGIRRC